MRSLTPLALVFLLGVLTSIVHAQDDLDLLLGELTFPDTDQASQTLPAAPEPAPPVELPEAEKSRGRAPLLDPVTTGSPVAASQSQQPSDAGERDAGELRELPPWERQPAGDGERPGQAAGKPETVEPAEPVAPVEEPPARIQPPVEPLPSPAAEAPPAGPSAENTPAHPGAAAMPPAPHSAAGPGAVAGLEAVGPAGHPVRMAAVPADLRRPNLPPPSSLRGYFRSSSCYRDLWAGYGQEVQQRCHHYHKHLHGMCDCFEPPYSPPVYQAEPPAASRCACSKCN